MMFDARRNGVPIWSGSGAMPERAGAMLPQLGGANPGDFGRPRRRAASR